MSRVLLQISILVSLGLLACNGEGPGATPAHDTAGGDSSGSGGSGGNPDDTGEELFSCSGTENSTPLSSHSCVDEAPCSWEGDQSYAYFGYVLDGGADLDGDGRDDVVVGAPTWDSGSTVDGGRASIISGGSLDDGEGGVAASLQGTADGDFAGTSLAIVGDVNGDGIADLLVGARGADAGGEESGEAQLLMGRTDGFEADLLSADASWVGSEAYSRVGTTVGGGGDLDGDGLADLLVPAELSTYDVEDEDEDMGAGAVHVVLGSAAGFGLGTDIADSDARFAGESDGDGAGLAVASADLDGDGYAEIIVGAPYAGSKRGQVYVIAGSAAAPASASLSEATLVLQGDSAYDAYGWSLATGDVTGDGLADLAIGAPLNDASWSTAGLVVLVEGSTELMDGTPSPRATWLGEFDDTQLGMGLALGRDISGDGVGDLVMGAVSTYAGLTTKSGRTYVVHGGSDWPSEAVSADTADVMVHGGATKDYLGRANTVADLDNDGTSDLVIASGYVNTSTGYDAGKVYLFWGG